MSKYRRRRRSPGLASYSLFAPGRADLAYVFPAVPRYVLANFDRWLDATRCGAAREASRLALLLRREGYGVATIWRPAGDKYQLRRLD